MIADTFKDERIIVVPNSIRLTCERSTITSQMFISHIGYYPNTQNHHRERMDGCNENILLYCIEGRGWISYKDTNYFLSQNQVFIIPAREAHAYGSVRNDPWRIYWLHFQGTLAYQFSSIMGRVINIQEADSNRYADRIQLFEEIYRNLEKGYTPQNLEYTTYCLLHFLASLKYIDQYREIKKMPDNNVIQKSINYMKNNLEHPIELSDIARYAGYSESRLNSLFKAKFSIPPMAYYTHLKILRSCSYLQFSNLKIKEIAFRLGFCDPFHFSKTFQREMHTSPREYRKKNQDLRQNFGM